MYTSATGSSIAVHSMVTQILSIQSPFAMTNVLLTVSHKDCDYRLRLLLVKVGST